MSTLGEAPQVRLADFAGPLGLSEDRQALARYLLLGWTAKRIGAEINRRPRMVYKEWQRIRARLKITGLAGLAQAVYSSCLVRIEEALVEARGPPLVPLLEGMSVEGASADRLRQRPPRREVREYLLADIVHRLGLPGRRQRKAARRLLRGMSLKRGAHDLGIARPTFKDYIEQCLEGIGAGAGNRRCVLVLADAVFSLALLGLQDKLRRRGCSIDVLKAAHGQ